MRCSPEGTLAASDVDIVMDEAKKGLEEEQAYYYDADNGVVIADLGAV